MEAQQAFLRKNNHSSSASSKAPFLVGHGYDTHGLTKGRRLILGGVEVPFHKGLQAHSDGDVVLHALIDAVLGAMGWGDIGAWFPDTDDRYKNIDSKLLLTTVMKKVWNTHHLCNADITVLAQRPKLALFFPKMKEVVAKATRCEAINLKATTTEGMNDEGKGACISAMAVCLLMKNKDKMSDENEKKL